MYKKPPYYECGMQTFISKALIDTTLQTPQDEQLRYPFWHTLTLGEADKYPMNTCLKVNYDEKVNYYEDK